MKRLREVQGAAGERVEAVLDLTKSVVYYTIVIGLVLNLLLFVSIFMYGTFYFAFVPAPEHQGPLHPVFEPCEDKLERCGFLNASVLFSLRDPILMTGQPYTVSIVMEVPESVVNRKLGMFMNCLQVKTVSNELIRKSCKSSMLQYRSELLRVMETFFYAPILLTGYSTEKQFIRIEFVNDFQDNPLNPAVRLDIQIMSRFIELYSVQYQIHANFSGLRYLMFYYPVISAFFGIGLNMSFLSTLILLSWYRFFSVRESKDTEGSELDEEEEKEEEVEEEDEDEEKEFEKQTSSDLNSEDEEIVESKGINAIKNEPEKEIGTKTKAEEEISKKEEENENMDLVHSSEEDSFENMQEFDEKEVENVGSSS